MNEGVSKAILKKNSMVRANEPLGNMIHIAPGGQRVMLTVSGAA